MAYNVIKDVEEMLSYLEQCAGFYYLQNPATWQECFELLKTDPKLVGLVGGDAQATIINIANAYASVGKDIYATAESGLKSAPVIESVFTQPDVETAEVGASALGTYVAGTSVALPLSVALAGVLGGLGIGILSYETAPEGWVDISNYIFGTNISYEEVQPLIRTSIQAMFSKDSNDKPQIYLDEKVLTRAYDYFKTHVRGGINYDFLENTTWEKVSQTPNLWTCTSGASALNNLSFDLASELKQEYITYAYDDMTSSAHAYNIELPEELVEPTNCLNNLYSLYPNYRNANLFSIHINYIKTFSTVNACELVINGYVVDSDFAHDVDVSTTRRVVDPVSYDLSPAEYHSEDFSYTLLKDDSLLQLPNSALFSYKFDLVTGVGVVKDDGSTYYNYPNNVNINPHTELRTGAGGVYGFNFGWTTVGGTSLLYEFDEEFKRKGYLLNPKYSEDTDGVKASKTKPDRKTNFQDQYAYWYGGKKRVAQPSEEGEPEIHTYIPVPVPASMPDPAKVTKEGLGNAENPNSEPVAVPNAMPDALPNPLPAQMPISDPTADAVDNYNRSDVIPSTAPNPIPEYEPNPQYPSNPPTDPDGDSGDTPTPVVIGGVTASGMVSVYNPTKQQLIDFSAWLWSPNFLDNFLKIFANPMDAIIGLHIMYATPTSGGSEHIVAGYLDSGVSSKVVTKQYTKLNCGTVTVPEYFGNATDYEPYTTIHLYLPFIGIVPIRANDVLGKRVNVEYGIDALTGTCLATVKTIKDGSEIACYTFAGNCAVQIPVSGGNYAQMITALAGFVVAGAGAIVTGNPIMALGAGASFMQGNTSVQHSGAIGSNAGACGIRKPYFIITRKKPYDAQNYQHYYGFPSNNHVTLGSCKGYTQVKSCHVESIYRATDNEKTEIDSLLKQGVIIV